MSTFRGIIEELPGISVDRFEEANRTSSTVFFLSHFHTDHLVGLYSRSASLLEHLVANNQYMYGTPLTKHFLCSKYKDSQWRERIREITECQPIIVSYRDPNSDGSGDDGSLTVTVTAIPAGHCPGSIMFLFQAHRNDRDITILCTGDFRINPDDYPKIKPLHFKVNDKLVPKTIDNIYLDTTFYNVKDIPSRTKALAHIVSVVEDWLQQNPNNIIVLKIPANYGYESLFIDLSTALSRRIHRCPGPYSSQNRDHVTASYRLIPGLSKYVTEDPNETPIHGWLKQWGNFNCCSKIRDKKYILSVVPSAIRWGQKDLSKGIAEWDENTNCLYVYYSCHPSYNELKAFVDYFQPKKIHPCVVPEVQSGDAWLPESQKKIQEFQRKITDELLGIHAGGTGTPDDSDSKNSDCNLLEYKSFRKSRPQASDLSDDEF